MGGASASEPSRSRRPLALPPPLSWGGGAPVSVVLPVAWQRDWNGGRRRPHPICPLSFAIFLTCPLVCLPLLAGPVPLTQLLCFHLYLALLKSLGPIPCPPLSLPQLHQDHVSILTYRISFLPHQCPHISSKDPGRLGAQLIF